MAVPSGLDNWNFDSSDLYLNSDETDLLINALNSNKPEGNRTQLSPQRTSGGSISNSYLDLDTPSAFDWDLKAISTAPDALHTYPLSSDKRSDASDDGSDKYSPEYDDGEVGDKRKAESPEDDDTTGKRQETGKKGQKPGRKLLTSEPTTKRKAQNRAAQRAFRERKEKHLKDLEDKVDELQKKSDDANNENSILKAQVDRLQIELSEYRKKFSTTTTLQTSPFSGSNNAAARNSWDTGSNFNFEFPKFGLNNDKTRSASSGQDFNRNARSPTQPNRSNSQGILNNADLKGLFTADVLSTAERASNDNTPVQQNTPQFSTNSNRGLSPSNTASPASSGFNGFTSSCVTTPEYIADVSNTRKSIDASSKSVDKNSFCKDFQTACGNAQNPVPQNPVRAMSNEAPALTPGGMTTTSTEASLDFGSFDWLANQNGGEFNPALLGDYRESQENVMNNDGWFFNDAFTMQDFGSPLSHTETQTIPKKTFMQEIEDTQSGKEPEVVPGEAREQFLTCNLLWDRVQNSEKVMSGEADMDDLCSQLKAKAKCSGSGAVISQNDVDAILGPVTAKEREPNYLNMFK